MPINSLNGSSGGGGGGIKSIQHGTTGLGGGVYTSNTTISAVDLNKAYVIWRGNTNGHNHAGEAGYHGFPRGAVSLTSSTNVQCTRGHNSGFGITVFWTVIEYN